MSDREAFVSAIAANPDDDLPRLVYADWLDENGDPDRAEFIRLQCHSARVGPLDPSWAPAKLREFELFQANEASWRPGQRAARSHAHMAHWRRGFPACVWMVDVAYKSLTNGEWCNGAFDYAACTYMDYWNPLSGPWPHAGPVRELTFEAWQPGCGPLLQCEWFRTVRTISLGDSADLRHGSLTEFIHVLADLPAGHFPELRALDFHRDEMTLTGLETLADIPALGTVTRLDLFFPTRIPPAEVPPWAAAAARLFARVSTRLERLSLNRLPSELVPAFADVVWPRLRSLAITHAREDGLSAYDFTRTPNLTALSIDHRYAASFPDRNPLDAVESGWPESLKVLSLGSVPLERLRPWLADPERFPLDFLSVRARASGPDRLRTGELNRYPLTRGLKGLAGSFTTADLAPLTDPGVLPGLHTVWSADTEPAPPRRWRGGVRTVIPRVSDREIPQFPNRGVWCDWHTGLFG